MRTISGWRRGAPEAGALTGLDADALAAAAENPDHGEAARAAARSAGARAWRLAVPGFISAADLAEGDALFFGWGRLVRLWSGWVIFLIFAGMFVVAALTPDRAPIEPGERFTIRWLGLALDSDLVFGVLGLVTLGVIAIWFLATALRRRPARVLLLRKFNRRALAVPLERMMAQELRPYGHIASLSDKFIRRDTFGWVSTAMLSLTNPLAAIWFVIGAPPRLIWRLFDRSRMGPAVVLNARDYRNFAARLRDRIGLNLQVALTSKEAFLVRTSDAWWRTVVRLLMDSADAIVVDLSKVSDGTAWELDVIQSENAAARCVFVSLWGKAEEAERALRARGFSNPCFHYAPDGEMQHREAFRAAMLAAMRATHPA